jgi:hypothetical protein
MTGYNIFLKSAHTHLHAQYQLLYNGEPINPVVFFGKSPHPRVLMHLKFGRTPLCPPSTDGSLLGDDFMEIKRHAWEDQVCNVTVRPIISSDGGCDNSLCLRLLLLHPLEDVVLDYVDSERFAVMTRTLPTRERRITMLVDWGTCAACLCVPFSQLLVSFVVGFSKVIFDLCPLRFSAPSVRCPGHD